ncbi:hypothetical protein PoB_005297600 [Plakobranchus ocellatus]|uniref:Uncharacterized protein n=1 Tax=Plakobranchus ocellatus TaxID=259542 RepID=A0AAV4BTE8_9GAST|nr:hypothetical protein PoB_005297600 [Plakobranchus ocellatus]
MAGLEPAKEASLHISGRTHKPLSHQSPWAATPQQGNLRLSGNPLDQSASDRARTRDRRVPEISGRTR